jgi:putative tryptophan/tyrosine transport system substrate-binding protein
MADGKKQELIANGSEELMAYSRWPMARNQDDRISCHKPLAIGSSSSGHAPCALFFERATHDLSPFTFHLSRIMFYVSRFTNAAARAVAGLGLLLGLCTLCVPESSAMDIAILQSSDIAAYREAIAGLKATGPIGATYTEYDAQGDLELGKKLARKLRASDASLVVAVGLKAALAAKVEIVDVPVVYMMVLDPLKHQLTAANMTGTLLEVPLDRQMKIMRMFLPNLHRIGTLYDPAKTSSRMKDAVQQATISDFQLTGIPIESDKDVPQQLRALLAEVEALWLMPDSTVLTNESVQFILESALARQIPVIGFSPEFTRLGALLSMSVNYGEIGRETGLLVKRILNGEKRLPHNPMPIERFKITLNLKTAKFLGMTFPKELTSLIDETY